LPAALRSAIIASRTARRSFANTAPVSAYGDVVSTIRSSSPHVESS
jgi:hypothetical protein